MCVSSSKYQQQQWNKSGNKKRGEIKTSQTIRTKIYIYW